MLQKTVIISGQEVTFKSSAAIPRLYRIKFGRDIFRDLSKLEKAYKANAGKECAGLLPMKPLTKWWCMENKWEL